MATQEQKERDCVRELARQIAEAAARKENEIICQRWRDVNALRKPDRAPVWCRPVGAIEEILPKSQLVCRDRRLQSIEYAFRRMLHKLDIGDDEPLESCFSVAAAFDVDPPNTWGVDIARHKAPAAGGAWKYDPPLKSSADLDKLRMPVFTYNEERTQQAMEQTGDLLGDILPVRLTCGARLGATLCNAAANLVGLEPLMLNAAVEPEYIHALMAHLRDATLAAMDAAEASGLVTPNNVGPMNCSDPIGEPDGETYTLKNCWCMANSQEFEQISPAMWEEFLLAYQRPIFEHFGLVGYGCCENLTQKIDPVLTIPNLRIFVSSAWTDLDKVVEKVGTKHCIMWRQKASDVVFPDDTSGIRRHLEEGMKRLQGCCYQVVLRELQTLAGHPNRLHEWAEIGKELAAKYA